MKILILSAAVLLTGCAAPFEMYAHYLNTQDPCQLQNIQGSSLDQKVANMPKFCGASAGRTYIYNNRGLPVGYIK